MSIWLDLKYKVKGEDCPIEYNIVYRKIRDAFRCFTTFALQEITGEEFESIIHNTYNFGNKFGVNFTNEPNPNQKKKYSSHYWTKIN